MAAIDYKVSIIVPVYNGHIYLERAIGSILAQSLREIEIIVIDDHSTDVSAAIAQNLAAACPQLHFYSNHGRQGQGICRNLGVQKARGEFVAFLDCDDFLEENFCEKLYACAQATRADFVVCGYDKLAETDFFGTYLPPAGLQKGGRAILPLLDQTELLVWNKLYRRRFLLEHQLEHTIARYGEDWLFCLACYYAADTYYNLPEPLYYYYQHRESFSHARLPETDFSAICDFLRALAGFLAQHPELSPAESAVISRQLLFSLFNCYLRPAYRNFSAGAQRAWQETLLRQFPGQGFLLLALLDYGLVGEN